MTTTAEEIQLDINAARELVKDGDRLMRLHENEDFKALIVEGYFKAEPARLTQIKAHPGMQSDEQQQNILRALDAIGGLQQYFHKIFIQADQAEEAIRVNEQELENMAEEGEI